MLKTLAVSALLLCSTIAFAQPAAARDRDDHRDNRDRDHYARNYDRRDDHDRGEWPRSGMAIGLDSVTRATGITIASVIGAGIN